MISCNWPATFWLMLGVFFFSRKTCTNDRSSSELNDETNCRLICLDTYAILMSLDLDSFRNFLWLGLSCFWLGPGYLWLDSGCRWFLDDVVASGGFVIEFTLVWRKPWRNWSGERCFPYITNIFFVTWIQLLELLDNCHLLWKLVS